MKVFLSEIAEIKLLRLCEYLVEHWNIKTKTTFLSKLDEKIAQISHLPMSCPHSTEFPNLYKCVVTKQTTFYYRISDDESEIEIIAIFDTRRNPKELRKELE